VNIAVTEKIFLSEDLFKPEKIRIIKLVKMLIPVTVGKLKSDQLIPYEKFLYKPPRN
jgi:hypothetical protein